MLLCSSKIPVSDTCTPRVFVGLAIEWVRSSRNYSFEDFSWDGSPEFIQSGNNGEVFQVGLFKQERICAVHFSSIDENNIKWTTDFVLDIDDRVLAFQLYRDASEDGDYIPLRFNLPLLVKKILDSDYVGQDNGLKVNGKPILTPDLTVEWVADVMLRKTTYSMPVVYMSCERDGHCAVNPYALAERLNGVAHVIYETSKMFSRALKDKTAGRNPYGGAIEVFYPKGERKILPNQLNGSHSENVRYIVDAVCGHLNQMRVSDRFLWSHLQSDKLRNQLASTIQRHEQDSKDYSEFERVYEDILEEKESQIKRLQDQLNAANYDNNLLETQLSAVKQFPALVFGEERDLYPFEQQSFLLEILEKELQSSVPNSRKAHIISSLIKANQCENTVDQKRKRVKACLHGYKKMTGTVMNELQEIGFSLTNEGKHIKLVFGEDARYTGTLSKTGSDYRGGENTAHDLMRTIF